MRLLNTSTIELHEFQGSSKPDYAILSHTWGEEEVLFQDLQKAESKDRAGYMKIKSCCALAKLEGWKYVWVDTCCIDKTSSAELSEAINSMFVWYSDAKICYAYLADVSVLSLDDAAMRLFGGSRWFTRGWTLQELLAPSTLVFYDQDWKEIGTKQQLQSDISTITGIKPEHINDPLNASAAQKMSWASRRETTRLEDISYCLMGLFDVNMPLLYGEGQKAFMRLQYEIARYSDDESLFAWNDPELQWSGMFARSPAAFSMSGDIDSITFPTLYRRPWSVTNRGLAIDLDVRTASSYPDGAIRQEVPLLELAPLHCARSSEKDSPICIRMYRQSRDNLVRLGNGEIVLGKRSLATLLRDGFYERKTMYIRQVYVSKDTRVPISRMNPEIQSFDLSAAHHTLQKLGFLPSKPYITDLHYALWDSPSATMTLGQGFAALLFRQSLEEDFVLILRVARNSPTLDVLVQAHKRDLKHIIKASELIIMYGNPNSWPDSGATKFDGPLQRNHVLSVSLRKGKALGEKHYFVDLEIKERRPIDVSGDELISNGTHEEKVKKTPLFSRRMIGRK